MDRHPLVRGRRARCGQTREPRRCAEDGAHPRRRRIAGGDPHRARRASLSARGARARRDSGQLQHRIAADRHRRRDQRQGDRAPLRRRALLHPRRSGEGRQARDRAERRVRRHRRLVPDRLEIDRAGDPGDRELERAGALQDREQPPRGLGDQHPHRRRRSHDPEPRGLGHRGPPQRLHEAARVAHREVGGQEPLRGRTRRTGSRSSSRPAIRTANRRGPWSRTSRSPTT